MKFSFVMSKLSDMYQVNDCPDRRECLYNYLEFRDRYVTTYRRHLPKQSVYESSSKWITWKSWIPDECYSAKQFVDTYDTLLKDDMTNNGLQEEVMILSQREYNDFVYHCGLSADEWKDLVKRLSETEEKMKEEIEKQRQSMLSKIWSRF